MNTHLLALDPIDWTPNPTPPPPITSLPSLSMMSYGLLAAAVLGLVVCAIGLVDHRVAEHKSDSAQTQTDTTRKLLLGSAMWLVVAVAALAGVILL